MKILFAIMILFVISILGCGAREIRPQGMSGMEHQIEANDCAKRAGGSIIVSTAAGQRVYRRCMEEKGFKFE